MRLAYCTGMRRWACSTNTTAVMVTRATISTMASTNAPLLWKIAANCAGKPARIEAKISSDMPLPMPRSVMSSPNHITSTVPVVMVRIIVRITAVEVSGTIASEQPWNKRPGVRASATMPVVCSTARPTVRYRVYCVILA